MKAQPRSEEDVMLPFAARQIAIWNAQVHPVAKLVLLAMNSMANGHGRFSPESEDRIIELTRLEPTDYHQCLRQLREMNVLYDSTEHEGRLVIDFDVLSEMR